MTDDDLRDAWDSGLSERAIADAFGLPVEEVQHRRRRVLKLRRRKAAWVPTEEEIWGKLTLEIQATWSDATREARRVSPDKVGWDVPVIPMSEVSDEAKPLSE